MRKPPDHLFDADRVPPHSALEVEAFRGSPEEWDDFVATEAGGTHFHRYGWRDVMERSLGHPCRYLSTRDSSGKLVGVLPLVFVGSPIFGRYLVSVPFLNYGGPLGSEAAIGALSQEAQEEGRRRGTKLVELRSGIPLPIEWRVSHRKITVILELPGDSDELFAGFKGKLRSQLRRPMKEGVKVRIGPEQLDAFYTVFSRHMRDLGTPVLGKRFFQAVVGTFPQSARVAVAYLGDRPIAGGLGFSWGQEFEITWASSLREFNRTSANMLVYWELIQDSIRDGLVRFNFGRCSPGSGTHRFKTQWGGEDVPLFWYQASDMEEPRTPSPDDPLYAWGPRIWRRLPLPVADLVGPKVARLIP